MTRSMAIEELHDDEAVEALGSDEIAEPILAAIQHSFEEAMASIDDLARFPWTEPPLPGTEKIDLRLVKPPAARAGTTPPTAAMSLAARALAEQPVSDGACSSATASGPGPEGRRASASGQAVARGDEESPDGAAPRRRRPRWWRP